MVIAVEHFGNPSISFVQVRSLGSILRLKCFAKSNLLASCDLRIPIV
jgi:hypothetical protein